jgi:lipopolysaccharide export LptBFGC system permease protein LptF
MRGRAALAVGFGVLTLATIVVFALVDAGSHSASDTLRPFLLIAVPVWVAALLSAWLVVRSRAR